MIESFCYFIADPSGAACDEKDSAFLGGNVLFSERWGGWEHLAPCCCHFGGQVKKSIVLEGIEANLRY